MPRLTDPELLQHQVNLESACQDLEQAPLYEQPRLARAALSRSLVIIRELVERSVEQTREQLAHATQRH